MEIIKMNMELQNLNLDNLSRSWEAILWDKHNYEVKKDPWHVFTKGGGPSSGWTWTMRTPENYINQRFYTGPGGRGAYGEMQPCGFMNFRCLDLTCPHEEFVVQIASPEDFHIKLDIEERSARNAIRRELARHAHAPIRVPELP